MLMMYSEVYCKNSGDLPKSQKTMLNTTLLQILWWKCCTQSTKSDCSNLFYFKTGANETVKFQRVPSVSIWAKIMPHLCLPKSLLFMYRQFQKWVLNYFFSTFHSFVLVSLWRLKVITWPVTSCISHKCKCRTNWS